MNFDPDSLSEKDKKNYSRSHSLNSLCGAAFVTHSKRLLNHQALLERSGRGYETPSRPVTLIY